MTSAQLPPSTCRRQPRRTALSNCPAAAAACHRVKEKTPARTTNIRCRCCYYFYCRCFSPGGGRQVRSGRSVACHNSLVSFFTRSIVSATLLSVHGLVVPTPTAVFLQLIDCITVYLYTCLLLKTQQANQQITASTEQRSANE